MSFDIFFISSRWSDEPQSRTNPFTGETSCEKVLLPLSDRERIAAQAVLEELTPEGLDNHGCYSRDFAEGGSVEVFAEDLVDGCMVAIRGSLSDPVLDLLLRLGTAGNMSMCPAMDPPIVVATSDQVLRNAPATYKNRALCTTIEELRAVLANGFEGWKRFRDMVVDS